MNRLRIVSMGAATAALALSSVSAPVAAADDAEVVFVHGLPSVNRIDICVDNVEVKSRLKYGKATKIGVSAAVHKLVAKKAAPGKCKGKTLAKDVGALLEGDSETLVLLKAGGTTTFQTFDNTVGPTAAPASSPLLVQNAAKAGKLDVYVSTFLEPTAALPPTFHLARGDQGALVVGPAYFSVWGSKPGKVKPLIGPSTKRVVIGKRRHFVLIGSKPANHRVVSFQTTEPTP